MSILLYLHIGPVVRFTKQGLYYHARRVLHGLIPDGGAVTHLFSCRKIEIAFFADFPISPPRGQYPWKRLKGRYVLNKILSIAVARRNRNRLALPRGLESQIGLDEAKTLNLL
jgi:hypothetical protein